MSKIKKGDLVQHTLYGYVGYVEKVYDSFTDLWNDESHFKTMSAEDWLEMQVVRYTPEQLNSEQWFFVKCVDGGSIISCFSRFEIIDIEIKDIFQKNG